MVLVLDVFKFNYLLFGLNLFSLVVILFKEVVYFEEWFCLLFGYKDIIVLGIFLWDILFLYGNYELGWVVVFGM